MARRRFGQNGAAPSGASSRILPGYGGALVAITAQVTLNPGDSIDLPADALRNGLGLPVLVDSFRWTADAQQNVGTTDPPASSIGNLGMPGAGVTASIKVENQAITAGEIPLYCLAASAAADVEHSILGVQTGGANAEIQLGAFSGGIWTFDHPFSMDVQETLTVHLTHRNLLNLPVVVTLSLAGRAGLDLPRSNWLPYVSSWIPATFNPSFPTSTAPLVITSTERDLINRAPAPVYISRFIGRLMRIGVSGNPIGTGAIQQNQDRVFPSVEEAISGQPTSEWFPGAVENFMGMTLRDSRANDNVPTAIPFRLIFEPERHSWECPHVLDPGGYYVAQATLSVPTVIDQAIQLAVSMVGSWEGG